MATTQAASASPTHRAASPPPYPSAARIADSVCFSQYTASLKCVWRPTKTRASASSSSMITKNAKRKRGRLGSNETGHGHSSNEQNLFI